MMMMIKHKRVTKNKTWHMSSITSILFHSFIQRSNNERFFMQISIILRQLKRMTMQMHISCIWYGGRRLKNALIVFLNSTLKPPRAGRAYRMRETIMDSVITDNCCFSSFIRYDHWVHWDNMFWTCTSILKYDWKRTPATSCWTLSVKGGRRIQRTLRRQFKW